MAIPASQALLYERVQITEHESKVITEIEKNIDEAIEKQFEGHDLRLSFSALGLSGKVIVELSRRYSRVGWFVRALEIRGPGSIQSPDGKPVQELMAYQFTLAVKDETDNLRQKVVEAAIALVDATQATLSAGEPVKEKYAMLAQAVEAYKAR